MQKNVQLNQILERALEGKGPSWQECAYLLSFAPTSSASNALRLVANQISRQRFSGRTYLFGQLELKVAPCEGRCAFCAYAKQHTTVSENELSLELAKEQAIVFAYAGANGIFLRTIQDFDFDRYLDKVTQIRQVVPARTELLANVGELSYQQLVSLKAAGITGVYHTVRLREGMDTRISPIQRMSTIAQIRNVGLDWYYACEPIGPEHNTTEIIRQIFIGIELGCHHHGVMRRFPVPGSSLHHFGQLPVIRLAQIGAVVVLAALGTESVQSIGFHEPHALGLMSGANALYSEARVDSHVERSDSTVGSLENMSDASASCKGGKEMKISKCLDLFHEAGFIPERYNNKSNRNNPGSLKL